MAATVAQDSKNDTKAIAATMKEVGKDVTDLEKALATVKKLSAAITKSPDDCKKDADALCDAMSDVLSISTGWKNIPKELSKAIKQKN